MNTNEEIWVTNISNRNVMLSDLRYAIPAGKSINLLGKGFNFTKEQIEKSICSGSIFKKSYFIKIRKVKPIDPSLLVIKIKESDEARYSTSLPPRSMVKIETPKFEELGQSDIDFIDQITNDE